MKRKVLLGAFLLGVFIFTSCVENEESLSVEELRKSKSELLKSEAAMKAAEAEATKILAAADVALKNAQAEAEKANALKIAAETEIIKLQAKLQETENEQAKVALQSQLDAQVLQQKENELELKRIANDLQLAETQLQVDLAKAEKLLLEAQQALTGLKDDIAEAEKQKLQILAGKYAQKVSELNTAKQILSGMKSYLVLAENDLVSLEESKAKNIEQNNRDIAFSKAQIETYKQYADYNDNPQELYEIANAKYNEYLVAWNDGNITSLREEYYDLDNKTGDKLQPVFNTDFYNVINDWTFSQYISFPSADYTPNSLGYKWVEIENADLNQTYYYYKIIYPEVGDLRQLEIQIRERESWKDDAQSTLEFWEGEYETAIENSAIAKEAWEDAKGTPDEWSKQNDYQIAIQNENNVKNSLENAGSYLQYCQDQLDRYQNAYDVLSDADKLAEIKTAIDTYNAQFADVVEAYFAWQKAQTDVNKLFAEYSALWDIYDRASDIDSLIADREQRIKDRENANADISGITSQEELIEALTSEIDAQEKVVDAAKKAADAAKKAYEDALAEL
ncbi:putative secreted protein [Proteiniphilum saccharofermentans]|uniref:Putative secreted protein n=1 Tax=Proteiniphilum saccharofermentans TaxID=1642647 RepID=A0A1R3SXM3_9BACT|nr:hypothetical protein [Proteiniphilum saccharofermentans]SCD20271.1 putative secreted protein [Proteiniphilum saccharofermentans]